MIEFLFAWLMQCILIPDVEEFGQCVDQLVLEYNQMIEWDQDVEKLY